MNPIVRSPLQPASACIQKRALFFFHSKMLSVISFPDGCTQEKLDWPGHRGAAVEQFERILMCRSLGRTAAATADRSRSSLSAAQPLLVETFLSDTYKSSSRHCRTRCPVVQNEKRSGGGSRFLPRERRCNLGSNLPSQSPFT